MARCRNALLLCVAVGVAAMTTGSGLFDGAKPIPPPWEGCPDWVWKDLAGIYPDDGKEHLYARGMSEKAITQEMTHERARSSAQAAMAERLKLSVAKLLKDWMSTSEDLVDPTSPVGKRYTEIVSRKLTDANLYGCNEVEWVSAPTTGAVYSLMRMPVKGNSALRSEIRKQAEQELRKAEEGVVTTGDTDAAIKSLDDYLEREARTE